MQTRCQFNKSSKRYTHKYINTHLTSRVSSFTFISHISRLSVQSNTAMWPLRPDSARYLYSWWERERERERERESYMRVHALPPVSCVVNRIGAKLIQLKVKNLQDRSTHTRIYNVCAWTWCWVSDWGRVFASERVFVRVCVLVRFGALRVCSSYVLFVLSAYQQLSRVVTV